MRYIPQSKDLQYTPQLMKTMTIERQELYLVEDSGSVYLDVGVIGGGDLSVFLNGEIKTLDCTTGSGVDGKARVEIPQGTASSIKRSFVYASVDETDDTVKLYTAETLPTGDDTLIAIVGITIASHVAGGFVPIFQRITEAISHDGKSAISWMREKMRAMGTIWQSGIEPNLTITTNAGSEDDIDLSITSGIIFQLHRQMFPSLSISSDGIYLYNVKGTGSLQNFQKVTNLNVIHEDGTGTTLTDGDCIILTIGASINYDSDTCLFFAALPNGKYTSETDAKRDLDKYAYSYIPQEFQTTGFFICKLVLKYETADNGTWNNVLNQPKQVWSSQVEDENSPNYPSNYPNNTNQNITLTKAGADSVRVVFDDFNTEAGYDFVYVRDGSNNLIATYNGNLATPFTSPEIPGDEARIQFTSDSSVVRTGWHISALEWSQEIASGAEVIDLRGIKAGWSL